ncbi:MAG: hypothetical protein PUJ11_05555 [Eubacteriaceae bacterium]|nr:hypothetical protein [Eubacteriaceae bacterium]
MRIEILFPEICNLYGELFNMELIKKSCPDAEFTETNLNDEPLFSSDMPDLIYMGTMSEKSQELVIEKLSAYKDRIAELIEKGANFLITGNALEIFGNIIEDKDGTVVKGLGLFPFTTKRDMMNRFNSLYIGEFTPDDSESAMKIVGFKSQFTHSYWNNAASVSPLFETLRGPGLNPDIKGEGIRVNNFMATYVIGPLLVLNPPFSKYLLAKCGTADNSIVFEDAAMEAYNARVEEYSDESTGFYY